MPRDFFEAHTVQVARELLGKIILVRFFCEESSQRITQEIDEGFIAGRIVETEAYRGEDDPASHASRGRTPRSSIMFGKPGVAYVYLIYGMYEMLNFVTEPEGKPGAVLIRALEPLGGIQFMKEQRKTLQIHSLTNGPGRLCRALGIKMSHLGQSLQGPFLYVCDDGFYPSSVSQSARVGIQKGSEMNWRFFLTQNAFVSPVKQNNKSTVLR